MKALEKFKALDLKSQIGIGIVLIVVFWFLSKKFGKINDGARMAKKYATAKAAKPTDNSTAVVADAAINGLAERHWGRMKGGGTDEDGLLNDIRTLNGTDLKNLYFAFGNRRYYDWHNPFGTSNKIDVFGWYEEELDQADLNKMIMLWKKSGLI